jgi:otoferlin
MYQARSLIGSDASGLSDPYAQVVAGEWCKTTQVVDETLSPTWDELLVFPELMVCGLGDEIKKEPPNVVIEIFDQDKVVSAFLFAKQHSLFVENGLNFFREVS